jgi:hypothetical protein
MTGELEDASDAFCCGDVTFLKGGYENQFSLRRLFEYKEKKYEVKATKLLEEIEEHPPMYIWHGGYETFEIKGI